MRYFHELKSKNSEDWQKIKTQPSAKVGYSEYRYGAKKPVTISNVWKSVEVGPSTLVDRVARLVDHWRFNRWEKEGAVRRGVRLSLIAEGNGWQMADDLAAEVINRAFVRLGRGKETRPSSDEGQRWITRRFDQCLFCGEDLPRRAYTGMRADYFCCAEHAERGSRLFELPWDHRISRAASRLIYRESQPLKHCQNLKCGEPFHPLPEADGKFCCRECKDEAQRTLLERECADADCTVRFVPQKGHIEYCSKSCAAKNRKPLPRVEKTCAWCNGRYGAVATSNSMYCSNAHKQAAFKAAKRIEKKAEPVLTPDVFDGWFIVYSPAIRKLFDS